MVLVDTSPEPAGHVGFFLWGYVPDPYTLYKGIRALPAGTSLWVDAGGRGEPRPFFNLREMLVLAEERARTATAGEMREQLREALLDSVKDHLIADVPVGIFLSSGIDSTTLAALARESGAEELRTVTLAFDEYRGKRKMRPPLAEQVAEQLGARHETRRVRRDEFESGIRAFLCGNGSAHDRRPQHVFYEQGGGCIRGSRWPFPGLEEMSCSEDIPLYKMGSPHCPLASNRSTSFRG